MKRKKMIRNILIAAAVVILIVAVILLSIALRGDYRGYNWFERNAKVVEAGGETVRFGEFIVAFDNLLFSYESSGYDLTAYTDEQIKELQEQTADSLLLQKLYQNKCKELGLSLTAEEKQACKDAAQREIDAVVEQITSNLIQSGSYSKAAVDSQVASYYNRNIGMSQTKYYNYVYEQMEASYCLTKLEEHYAAEMKDYTEEELLTYYEETTQANFADVYETGIYSTYMLMYGMGYYGMPYLYVPEDFLYIDLIEVNAEDEATVTAFIERLQNGESFDELSQDELVSGDLYGKIAGPYAIGAADYSYLVSDPEVYTLAEQLQVGEISSLVVSNPTTDADGNETTTYTGYIFRRAEGNMCIGGAQNGIVDIDYYDGVREEVEVGMQQDKFSEIALVWLEDEIRYEALYRYESVHFEEGHTH